MSSTINSAIAAVAAGGVVVVVDSADREDEGDLIMAAEAATPDWVAFFLKHTSGVICAALTGERLDELGLPLMVQDNQEAQGTAFTVSVDLAEGTTTGISAGDRSRTLRALSDGRYRSADFVRPGHVFPLRARDGGVLQRAGHTEAAVDLARLAGLGPAAVLCEVVTPDKSAMARRPELRRLAQECGLPLLSIADLVRHRQSSERLVREIHRARVPTKYGSFVCHAWEGVIDGVQHLAVVHGDIRGGDPVLVRVHSECVTGDVFGSTRCDCGAQLDDALQEIAREGRGVVVYLRGHEGRGIGLANKLAAYNLQDEGYDTVDANVRLGLPVDDREYAVGAQILVELGVSRMRLMTNNPTKYSGLDGYGLELVERVPMPSRPTRENLAYLSTKRRRLGHLLPDIEEVS